MSKRYTRALAAVGAAAILVVGVDAIGYAANGQSLLLGKSNKAGKITEVKRTKAGPVLKLTAKKPTAAPFTTNAKGKVVNLNADKVDGINGTTLKADASDIKAIRFKDTAASRPGNTTYALSAIPAGTYLTSFNASMVPNTRGTQDLPTTVSCYLSTAGIFGNVLAQSTVVDTGTYYVAPSFSNVLTLTGNEDLQLFCGTTPTDGWDYSSGLFSSSGEAPTLTFTRLDGVTDKTLAP